jgi:aminoglycoside phosphotransferase
VADRPVATRSLSSSALNPQFVGPYPDRFLESYGASPVDAERLAFYRLLDECL